MIDIDKLKRDAVGCWPAIYAALGIDVGSGNHKPCPCCGGEDRFRLTNETGVGEWFCNGCSPKAGDGFALVMKYYNADFKSACEKVAGVIGGCEKTNESKKPKKDNRKRNIDLWRSSKKLNGWMPVDLYLRSRGIFFEFDNIRHCADCWCSELGKKVSAMVAPVQNPDGKAVSIHRTYLNDDGTRQRLEKCKMLTPVSEKICGGAIRLKKPKNGILGVAEGIETAMSCFQLFDVPTWACVGTTIMEGFVPPNGVRTVTIFGDNDANFEGQKSAYTLASRLFREGYLVEVVLPDEVGDFNDVLRKEAMPCTSKQKIG